MANALISTVHLPWYTWGSAATIQVRFRFLAIEGLQQVLELARAVAAPDQVIGGILTGHRSKPRITEISGFQPLLKLDPESVERAFHENGNATAGYYRILSDGSLRLTDTEFALTPSLFSHPNSVALLIDAASRPARATFLYWDESKISTPIEFPLDAALLSEAERNRFSETEINANIPRRKDAVVRGALASTLKSQKPSRTRLVAGTLVTASMLTAGTGLWLRYRKAATPPASRTATGPLALPTSGLPASGLGLRIERSGRDLFLSWDRNAPPIAAANFGIILVKSGNDRREIVLTRDQLQTGKVFYTATSDQMDIELTVVSPERNLTTESLVVVLQSSDIATPDSFAGQSAPNLSSPTERSAIPAPSAPAEQTTQLQVPRRVFVRPASLNAGFAPSIEEPPPPLEAKSDTGPLSLTATLPQLPPQIPAQPVPSPLPVAITPSPAATVQPAPAGPYHPPEVLVRRNPIFPDLLARFFFAPVAVDVELTIDTTGKVSNAELLTQHLNPALAKSVLDASRMWRFRPARQGNEPVASKKVVQFRFDPHP